MKSFKLAGLIISIISSFSLCGFAIDEEGQHNNTTIADDIKMDLIDSSVEPTLMNMTMLMNNSLSIVSKNNVKKSLEPTPPPHKMSGAESSTNIPSSDIKANPFSYNPQDIKIFDQHFPYLGSLNVTSAIIITDGTHTMRFAADRGDYSVYGYIPAEKISGIFIDLSAPGEISGVHGSIVRDPFSTGAAKENPASSYIQVGVDAFSGKTIYSYQPSDSSTVKYFYVEPYTGLPVYIDRKDITIDAYSSYPEGSGSYVLPSVFR